MWYEIVSRIWLFSWLREQVLIRDEFGSNDLLGRLDAIHGVGVLRIGSKMRNEIVLRWPAVRWSRRPGQERLSLELDAVGCS